MAEYTKSETAGETEVWLRRHWDRAGFFACIHVNSKTYTIISITYILVVMVRALVYAEILSSYHVPEASGVALRGHFGGVRDYGSPALPARQE